MNFIMKLRKASTEERVSLIQDRYQRNVTFFQQRYPDVIQFLRSQDMGFYLKPTETFFDLCTANTGAPCYVSSLDAEAELMGQYNHPGWHDMHNIRLKSDPAFHMHHEPVEKLRNRLAEKFPDCHERILSGALPVQYEKNGRRFAPPAVFLGIFHGLHIDYYLNEYEVPSLLLAEPDVSRFEMSLFFLDYPSIQKRFGQLYLAIGDIQGNDAVHNFFSIHRIHIRQWCRVFESYKISNAKMIKDYLARLQRGWTDIFFPFDVEFSNFSNGKKNIDRGLPILSNAPRISKTSTIVIAAAGPSLDSSLDWIDQNRDKILLFAVHSAVKALSFKGIKPDFQFNIDTQRPDHVIQAMELYRDVPLISDFRTGDGFIDAVDSILLCADRFKAAPYKLTCLLEDTHPSTTNLAFAFACFCKPQTIILTGCDCGYISPRRKHSEFTMHGVQRGGEDQILLDNNETLTTANFSEDGQVVTTTFLSFTRNSIEKCVRKYSHEISILNFSRGAKIIGVPAASSYSYKFRGGVSSREDIMTITDSFAVPQEGNNYKIYAHDSNVICRELKNEMFKFLRHEVKSRSHFSSQLDQSIDSVIAACRFEPDDNRVFIYTKLLTDLLGIFNCYMLATATIQEMKKLMVTGREILEETIDSLTNLPT